MNLERIDAGKGMGSEAPQGSLGRGMGGDGARLERVSGWGGWKAEGKEVGRGLRAGMKLTWPAEGRRAAMRSSVRAAIWAARAMIEDEPCPASGGSGATMNGRARGGGGLVDGSEMRRVRAGEGELASS